MFFFARFHCAAGNEQQMVHALNTVVAASRNEAGCVSIAAFRAIDDSRLFFIHSVWHDAAAFELHASLPHTRLFLNTVDPLLDQPRQTTRTTQLVPAA